MSRDVRGEEPSPNHADCPLMYSCSLHADEGFEKLGGPESGHWLSLACSRGECAHLFFWRNKVEVPSLRLVVGLCRSFSWFCWVSCLVLSCLV